MVRASRLPGDPRKAEQGPQERSYTREAPIWGAAWSSRGDLSTHKHAGSSATLEDRMGQARVTGSQQNLGQGVGNHTGGLCPDGFISSRVCSSLWYIKFCLP